MSSESNSVDTAPNLCQIKIKIETLQQSSQFPDKVELTFDLLESSSLDGPDFISRHVGKQLEGFAFNPPSALVAGTLAKAQASYIGGPHSGVFHLSEIHLVE